MIALNIAGLLSERNNQDYDVALHQINEPDKTLNNKTRTIVL
jgi:hypothetical protein